jgi:hypothetical protein
MLTFKPLRKTLPLAFADFNIMLSAQFVKGFFAVFVKKSVRILSNDVYFTYVE